MSPFLQKRNRRRGRPLPGGVGFRSGITNDVLLHGLAMEAEVEASDIIDDPKKAALEERFRRLERGDTKDALDDELAALKNRLKDR